MANFAFNLHLLTVAGSVHKMAEKKWTCARCAHQLYPTNHRWCWGKTSPSPLTTFMTCPQSRIPSITPASENLLMGKDKLCHYNYMLGVRLEMESGGGGGGGINM